MLAGGRVVYFSRGTLPTKKGERRAPSWGTEEGVSATVTHVSRGLQDHPTKLELRQFSQLTWGSA